MFSPRPYTFLLGNIVLMLRNWSVKVRPPILVSNLCGEGVSDNDASSEMWCIHTPTPPQQGTVHRSNAKIQSKGVIKDTHRTLNRDHYTMQYIRPQLTHHTTPQLQQHCHTHLQDGAAVWPHHVEEEQLSRCRVVRQHQAVQRGVQLLLRQVQWHRHLKAILSRYIKLAVERPW